LHGRVAKVTSLVVAGTGSLEVGAFAGSSVVKVDLSESKMLSLPADVLRGCASLRTLLLGQSITTAERDCCAQCAALREVDLSHLTSIERNAFAGSSALAVATFGDALETVGERAFAGCALKKIRFTAALKSVGARAFAEMELDEVELTDASANWASNVFTKKVAKVVFRGVKTSAIPVHLATLAGEIVEPARLVTNDAGQQRVQRVGISPEFDDGDGALRVGASPSLWSEGHAHADESAETGGEDEDDAYEDESEETDWEDDLLEGDDSGRVMWEPPGPA
jgi:hypothetical protein